MRAWILVVLLTSCGPGGSLVTVDLWSDLSAGTEVTRARTVFYATDDGRELLEQNSTLGFADRLYVGKRIAEVEGLADGSYRVFVELYDGDGEIVLTQTVLLEVNGATSLTVRITRACRGVVCPAPGGDPDSTVCLGGRCVPPDCASGGCAQCSDASECPTSVACAEASCTDGLCLEMPRDGGCPAGQRCDLDVGCVEDTYDAGPAGSDAGPPPPPPECTSRGDCPADSSTSTGGCSYSGTCDESGDEPIERTTWSCNGGSCQSSTSSDTQPCSRDRDGWGCGGSSRSCGGACNPVSGNPCEPNGTRDCTLTERICRNGGCNDESSPDGTEACTLSPLGNACDDGDACTNPDMCAGDGSCRGQPDCPRSGLCSGGCPIPICSGNCFSYCDCI